MAAKITDAQRKALATIASERVFMFNSGATDVKGVTAATVKALRKLGMVTVNGASHRFVNGRATRRLILTSAALSLVNS
jgi:hypothetical protein